MKREPVITGWKESRVHRSGEHFFLRYGSAKDESFDKWLLIAKVGPPVDRIVPVQFAPRRDDPRYEKAKRYAIREIEFYMMELNEKDPWKYAQFHCGQFANLYSMIHWSFRKAKEPVVALKKPNLKPAEPGHVRSRRGQLSLPFTPQGTQSRHASSGRERKTGRGRT